MLDLIRNELFNSEDLHQNQEGLGTNSNEALIGSEETIKETKFNKANVSSLEAKEILSKQLLEAIVSGEIEYISHNCEQAGMQMAILEAFTRRFDEKTKLKTPLPVTYYLESELLEDDANSKKITAPTQKGLAYKEEMALHILQIKYQIMLRSGNFDPKSPEMIKVKKKLMEFYKRHCNRINKADKTYLEVIKRKLSEETEDKKVKTYRAGYLEEEKARTKDRIQKREDDSFDIIDDNLDHSASTISRRQFIKAFNFPYTTLTQVEAGRMFRAYEMKRDEINSHQLPEKNRLFIQLCSQDGIEYLKFSEGERTLDKGKKPLSIKEK